MLFYLLHIMDKFEIRCDILIFLHTRLLNSLYQLSTLLTWDESGNSWRLQQLFVLSQSQQSSRVARLLVFLYGFAQFCTGTPVSTFCTKLDTSCSPLQLGSESSGGFFVWMENPHESFFGWAMDYLESLMSLWSQVFKIISWYW